MIKYICEKIIFPLKGVKRNMKKIKRLLALSTAAVMMLSTLTAGAEQTNPGKPYTVFVNDKMVGFNYQQPYNENGRVFVPVRGVFEAMGFEVDYEPVTKTAYLKDEFHSVELTLGNTYFMADGKTVYPETPQFILNDCFMIPLRSVSEAVDAEVSYNNQTYIIDIKYDMGRDANGAVKADSPAAEKDAAAKETSTAAATETPAETTTSVSQQAEFNHNVQLNRVPFKINNKSFWFGQTNLPNPYKKVPGSFGFDWNIYKPASGEYYMLGTNTKGEIVAFYALTSDFSFDSYIGGSKDIKDVAYEGFTVRPYIRSSHNKNTDGRLYALFVCRDEYMGNVTMDSKVLDGVEFQLENMINTIRQRESGGTRDLEENENFKTAQDQADSAANNKGKAANKYEDVISNLGYNSVMVDRYLFEYTLHTPFYFDIFDYEINNDDIYNAIMYGGFYFIDTGVSYNAVDNILCYAQNIFITDDEYYSNDYNY